MKQTAAKVQPHGGGGPGAVDRRVVAYDMGRTQKLGDTSDGSSAPTGRPSRPPACIRLPISLNGFDIDAGNAIPGGQSGRFAAT